MKFTVQLVVSTDDGQEDTVLEVAVLEKEYQRIERTLPASLLDIAE